MNKVRYLEDSLCFIEVSPEGASFSTEGVYNRRFSTLLLTKLVV